MNADILHSGFDGLRVTLDTDIPSSFREKLIDAKSQATATNCDYALNIGGLDIAVRRSGGSAFSAHTGDYGAEFYMLDPENRSPNNPGITVDFRAFLLATGGLVGAQRYFEEAMQAFGIPYTQNQMRISRIDFAVDFLAPWFEPQHDALILPARTGKREFRQADTKEQYFANTEVTGLTAGKSSNRQLVIYDKRAEIIGKRKLGWLEIWNQTRSETGNAPLDLTDREKSRVWRFEARLGSKCLRRDWEIRNWFDLNAMIGDAFLVFAEKVRYATPCSDRNRSRWPNHDMWNRLKSVYEDTMAANRSGVVLDRVKSRNRAEHKRGLATQTLGLIISYAAASGIPESEFERFLSTHMAELKELSVNHPTPLAERLAKAEARYLFR